MRSWKELEAAGSSWKELEAADEAGTTAATGVVMDIQVSNDAICGFLECPICRGIAANAMSLSCCGHAICEGCADRIAGQPCPTCESRACTFRASRPIRSSVDEVRVGCDLCASQIRLAERLVHRPELCLNRMLRWTVSGCGLAACASECREQIASARLDAFMADHSELMEGRWPAVAGGGRRWPVAGSGEPALAYGSRGRQSRGFLPPDCADCLARHGSGSGASLHM